MDYKINLEDKSVIITGAASGIGLECVKGFLQNGSDVYMVDFNGKENEDKAAELRKAFPQNKIFTVNADLTKDQAISGSITLGKYSVVILYQE